MSGGVWPLIFRFTFVGNAVLFVLLIGGSQKMGYDPIDHAPVHIRHQLSVRMDQQPFWGEIYDAQAEWDVVGMNIIQYLQAGLPGDEIDGVVVDVNPGETVSVTWKAHNGQTATVDVTGRTDECPDPPVDCYNAYVSVVDREWSGVDQQMRVMVLKSWATA